ncbi:MAG: hypothetical protein CHACPFDD_02000 [Phycisphaerae bacterium]|nr:hypothetical protein [Phycisphaerae bacterium]
MGLWPWGRVPVESIAGGGGIADHAVMKTSGAACGLIAILVLPGCASWHYARLKLGQAPDDYGRVLPAEKVRRTERGLAFLSRDWTGRIDAIVVIVADNRRVAARVHATYREQRYGFGTRVTYRLSGEIDPKLYETQDAGPTDTLKLLLSQLVATKGDKLAVESHAWIAAGLTRLLQRFPNVAEQMGEPATMLGVSERVRGGGLGTVSADSDGVLRFAYEWSGDTS